MEQAAAKETSEDSLTVFFFRKNASRWSLEYDLSVSADPYTPRRKLSQRGIFFHLTVVLTLAILFAGCICKHTNSLPCRSP